MNAPHLTETSNAFFLDQVFKGLAQDEYLWTTVFVESPNSASSGWKGQRTQPHSCSDAKFANAYFSVAAFRGGDGRTKANFSRLFCVVLDDAGEIDIEPSWCLRTSAEKVQAGFILEEPITDIGIADRLHQALARGGRIASDASGNNAVRYVRLPVGINTKYEPAYTCELEHFNPTLRYSLSALLNLLGVDESDVMGAPQKHHAHQGQSDRAERISDSQYIQDIISGENYHEPILKLTARYVSRGMDKTAICETINGFMETAPDKGTERWKNRFADIKRTIDGAIQKYPSQSSPDILVGPLLKPYDYTTEYLKPVEYVIDGFISTGISMIAGEPGVGKSSMIVPLSCCAAHLCDDDDPLRPAIRRKVFYVSEDTGQVERILFGVRRHLVPHITNEEFKQWFEVVHAKRLDPSTLAIEIARVLADYVEPMEAYDARPLIVLDTANATLDIENENDNSEVGKAISAIKEVSDGMPIWIVAHMPKSTTTRDQIADLTVRGASAFTGDSQATLFIFKDAQFPDQRFMMLGKHRFVEEFDEILFQPEVHHQTIKTPWGNRQTQRYLVGRPERASKKDRLEKKKEIEETNAMVDEMILREEIISAIRDADPDYPLTRSSLKTLVRKKAVTVQITLDKLINDKKVYELEASVEKGKRGPRPKILSLTKPQESVAEEASDTVTELVGQQEGDPDTIRIMGFDPKVMKNQDAAQAEGAEPESIEQIPSRRRQKKAEICAGI